MYLPQGPSAAETIDWPQLLAPLPLRTHAFYKELGGTQGFAGLAQAPSAAVRLLPRTHLCTLLLSRTVQPGIRTMLTMLTMLTILTILATSTICTICTILILLTICSIHIIRTIPTTLTILSTLTSLPQAMLDGSTLFDHHADSVPSPLTAAADLSIPIMASSPAEAAAATIAIAVPEQQAPAMLSKWVI